MIYSNYDFLLLLPAFLVCFYSLRSAQSQRVAILAGSVIFLAWNGIGHVAVAALVAAAVFAYLSADRKYPLGRRGLLLIVSALVANLIYFKYRGFLLEIFGVSLPSFSFVEWLIPLGISFYTFEAISAAVDLHRRKQKVRALDWSLFIFYFPHLIAGPIVRYRQLAPQFVSRKAFSRRNLSIGLHLFTIGFLKKLAADPLGELIDPVWAAPSQASTSALALALLGFYVQIYADFSGYTDMGRGVARMMGYRLPINFRAPFFSATPAELFQRWHVSLSSWIRSFVYDTLALTVLRRVRSRRLQNYALLAVILIVMGIFGLWHGAAWHFVVFGLWLGVMIAGWTVVAGRSAPRTFWKWLASVAALQTCWLIGLILFRADSLAAAGEFFRGLGRFELSREPRLEAWCLAAVVVAFATQYIDYKVRSRGLARILLALRGSAAGMAIVAACFVLALLFKISIDGPRFAGQAQGVSLPSAGFIYFRF